MVQYGPSTAEYVSALRNSPKFGPQVVAARIMEERKERLSPDMPPVSPRLQEHLGERGIRRLYVHQHEAITAVREGLDVLVATPTASGKSMIYNLPVVDMLAADGGSALYIFPLKALAQDQLRVFESFSEVFPTSKRYGAIFDGDTSAYMRRRIREEEVPVLMTNPEMLHLSLLPYHGNWRHYFQKLRYIILDEVHTYRGVLGSHMAWVLRRLLRICASYGSTPTFVMLSATIGNPGELGEKLTGRRPRVITENGAASGRKHLVLLNPWDSAPYAASQLLEAAVKRKLRAIVYTQSRKLTELINLWTRPRLGELQEKLSSYRAGFLPEERREIERKLASGELYGVITTSALELGIDIGDLDVCILVGYPGSIMATYQRGGRVGRSFKESVIILVAQEDALDQYFMRNPDDFYDREVESAVLNPFNESIMEVHLQCCCAEIPLSPKEEMLQERAVAATVTRLTAEALLLQAGDGSVWFAARKYPQRQINLRGGGSQLAIIDQESGEVIGEVDSGRAMKECHPGAVYLHHATTWIVKTLDFEAREVVAGRANPSFSTRAMTAKNTTILETEATKPSYRGRVSFGRLRVMERVTGYQKRNNRTQRLVTTFPLDLPEQTMETRGLWLEIPLEIKERMEQEKLHFMGGIHAAEHAMIALFPLLALCDRNDIGGISCPIHEQTMEATIFIYDGHPGGVGLAEAVFHKVDRLLLETYAMVSSCECDNGCPSCVHSPKCGSGNRPIDKGACLKLLEMLLDSQEKDAGFRRSTTFMGIDTAGSISPEPQTMLPGIAQAQVDGLGCLPPRYGVFDLETQRSADEVGGWNRAERMGVSVGVVYDSAMDCCVTYLEHEIPAMVNHLLQLDLVVGFNNKRFDNRVISGYSTADLGAIPTIDLLEEVSNHLGYRLSLDRLAEHTLGEKKTSNGLQALAWYKEGRIDKIQKYCKKDVELTRDLLLHGLEKGYLLFANKAGKLVRLPLQLGKAIQTALQGRTRQGGDEKAG